MSRILLSPSQRHLQEFTARPVGQLNGRHRITPTRHCIWPSHLPESRPLLVTCREWRRGSGGRPWGWWRVGEVLLVADGLMLSGEERDREGGSAERDREGKTDTPNATYNSAFLDLWEQQEPLGRGDEDLALDLSLGRGD
ncbi:hypothetical protein E2C01_102275 [Portunus trituberculatus]|uniref:Uncharacterized protein n=1 Tax=Portunus trituberculatus TaxID=210409 RepID=A0A5B7KGW8_PORTR|nr:hypothetical protein [Portunus trituberculatus]